MTSLKDNILVAVLVIIMACPFILLAVAGSPEEGWAPPRSMSLSELAMSVKRAEIATIEVGGNVALVTATSGHVFTIPFGRTNDLLHTLAALGVSPEELAGVKYVVRDVPPVADWWRELANALPALIIGTWVVIAARASLGVNIQLPDLTNARARRFAGRQDDVRFADVAGVDDAKAELQEVVDFLIAPDRFASLQARSPRGVLLTGPPGTGKTLLARAVAGEAGVPFFSIAGSEFVEVFAGVGASRVRTLFERAKRSAPCIVFVDEVDAIGRCRNTGPSNVNVEREQALNQLLVEMDGFEVGTNVIVLAATNRSDLLDPALLRPGRFDRRVVVAAPDLRGREAILAVHTKGKPLDSDIDLAVVGQVTIGFSGADLANVVNESAILAARREKQSISMSELEAAIDRVAAGPDSHAVVAARDKQRCAYHESGHAVVVQYVDKRRPVRKVSIARGGQHLGSARWFQYDERSFLTQTQLRAALTAALAGHAAEMAALGEAASGAESDIEYATGIALRMVKQYGMSARVGPVALGAEAPLPRTYSDATACAIDAEVRALIDQSYERAVAILSEYRDLLEHLVSKLIRDETLEGATLQDVFDSAGVRHDADCGRAQSWSGQED